MSVKIKSVDRKTPRLLPPDLRDWVPEDDLVHFVIEAVDSVGLERFHLNHRGCGSAQYSPHMLLSLLIYCYANGIFSSRRIERATYRDVAVRYLTGDTHPDHDTICTFRRRNGEAMAEAFLQVLSLARRETLPRKMGEAQEALKERAKARAESERAAYEEKLERYQQRPRGRGGRKPKPPEEEPRPNDTHNLTDPDSRIMRKGDREPATQAYNAQCAVDADGSLLILSHHLTQATGDQQQLRSNVKGIPVPSGAPGLRPGRHRVSEHQADRVPAGRRGGRVGAPTTPGPYPSALRLPPSQENQGEASCPGARSGSGGYARTPADP